MEKSCQGRVLQEPTKTRRVPHGRQTDRQGRISIPPRITTVICVIPWYSSLKKTPLIIRYLLSFSSWGPAPWVGKCPCEDRVSISTFATILSPNNCHYQHPKATPSSSPPPALDILSLGLSASSDPPRTVVHHQRVRQ